MSLLWRYVPDEMKVKEEDSGFSGMRPAPSREPLPKVEVESLDKRMRGIYNKWGTEIEAAAEASGVDPMLLTAQIYHESRGDSKAVAETTNAHGLMQVTPIAAQDIGMDHSRILNDPGYGLLAGAMYLSKQLRRFDGNVANAIAAYHDGPTAVQKWLSESGSLQSGERGLVYRNNVLNDYFKMRPNQRDYDVYAWPNENSRLRTTGGDKVDDSSRVLRTPSEKRVFYQNLTGGIGPSAWEEVAGMRVKSGWYDKLEAESKKYNGLHYEPTREEFMNGLEKAWDDEPNSQLEDMWNAFAGGAAKSVTMAGTFAGLVGEKIGLGDGLLNKSLAGTAYIDRHFQVHDQDFFTQLAGAFGSTLPFLMVGGGAGWAIGRGALASMAGKTTATRLAGALAKGHALDKSSRIFGAMVGVDVGMTITEAATEAGGVYQDARAQGMDEDQAWAASQKTFWSNTGVLALTNIPYAVPGALPLKIAAGALAEGYQENIQSNISEAALNQRSWGELLLPNHPMEMLLGSIVGGVLSGAADVAGWKKVKDARKKYDATFGKGASDREIAPNEAIQNSAGFAASQMSKEELETARAETSDRLETLHKHLNGEDQGLIGSTEELQNEARNLQILYAAIHNESLYRMVEERVKNEPMLVTDIENRVKVITEISNKNDGKLNKELEEMLVLGVTVLARTGNLSEAVLTEAAAAQPALKGALEAYQEIYTKDDVEAPEDAAGQTTEAAPTATSSGTEATQEGTEAPMPEEPGSVREEIPPPAEPPAETESAPRRPEEEDTSTPSDIRLTPEQVTQRDTAAHNMLKEDGRGEEFPTAEEIQAELPKPFVDREGQPYYTERQHIEAKKAAYHKKRGMLPQPGSEADFQIHGMVKSEERPNYSPELDEVERLADKLGLRVFYGRQMGAPRPGAKIKAGQYQDGRILLNLDAPNLAGTALDFVLSHEIGHHLRSREELRPIVRDLLAKVKASTALEALINEKLGQYAPESVPEEVMADLIGEAILTDEGFKIVMDHLDANQRSKFLDWLRSFVQQLVRRPGETGRTGEILEARLRELEQSIRDYMNPPDAPESLGDNLGENRYHEMVDSAERQAAVEDIPIEYRDIDEPSWDSKATVQKQVDRIIAAAKRRAKGNREARGLRAFNELQDVIAARDRQAEERNAAFTDPERAERLRQKDKADREKSAALPRPKPRINKYLIEKDPNRPGVYVVFGTSTLELEGGAKIDGKNLVKLAVFRGNNAKVSAENFVATMNERSTDGTRFTAEQLNERGNRWAVRETKPNGETRIVTEYTSQSGIAAANNFVAGLRNVERLFQLNRVTGGSTNLGTLKQHIADEQNQRTPELSTEDLSGLRSYLQSQIDRHDRIKKALRDKKYPKSRTNRKIRLKPNGSPDADVVFLGFVSGYPVYAVEYVEDSTGNRLQLDEYFSSKAKANKYIKEIETQTTSPENEARRKANQIEEEIVTIREMINEIESGLSEEEAAAVEGLTTGTQQETGRVAQADIARAEEEAGIEKSAIESLREDVSAIEDTEDLDISLAEIDEQIEKAFVEGMSRSDMELLIEAINREHGLNIPMDILDGGHAPGAITEMDPNLLRKLRAQQLRPDAEPLEVGLPSTEEKMYVLNDLYEIVKNTADNTAFQVLESKKRLAAAKTGVKEAKARTEAYDTDTNRHLDKLRDLGDSNWVNHLINGGDVRVDDWVDGQYEPSNEVMAHRDRIIRNENRRLYNEGRVRELEAQIRTLENLDTDIGSEVQALYEELSIADAQMKGAVQRSDFQEFQDGLNRARSAQQKLDFISPSTSSYDSRGVVGFIGDVVTGNYRTGRPNGGDTKTLKASAHTQGVYEEQQTNRQSKIDPERSPSRIIDKAYTWFLDKLHMGKVTQEKLTGEDATQGALAERGMSWYLNMRTVATGWGAAAEMFFDRGVFSFFTKGKKFSDKGIRQILKENNILGSPEKYERLGMYMTARRIYTLSGRGTMSDAWSGFTGTDAEKEAYFDKWEAVMKDLEQDADLVAAADQFHEFSNAMAEFLVEMGNKSQQDLANLLNSTDFYSPLYAADPEALAKSTGLDRGRNIDRGISYLGEIDTRDGHQPEIMHPVEAISQNTIKYVHAGYMNYVKLRMADMLNSVQNKNLGYVVDIDPGTVLLREVIQGRPVPPNSVPQIVRTIGQKVGDAVEEGRIFYGVPESKRQAMIDGMLNPTGQRTVLDPQLELEASLYIAGMDLGDNMIAYLEDGKIRIMQVDPDLMAGFTSLKTENLNFFFRKAGQMSQWLKKGATSTPRFMILNLMRDFMSATVGSAGMIGNPADFGRFIQNWARGINSLITKDEFYDGFMLHGGGLSEFLATTPDELKARVENHMKSRNPKDFVLHPRQWGQAFAIGLDVINTMSRNTELLTRLAVYRTHLQQMEAQNPGRAHHVTSQLAAFASREGTIDFSRTGSQMKALNSLQPFLTASLAGTDKVMRSMFSSNGDRVGTAMRGFFMLTLPTLALHALNYDQDWYKEKSDWEKNAFWMFKLGDTIMRIPKPFDYGMIFASLPERMVDYFANQDPRGAKEWASLFHGQAYGGSLEIGGWLDTILPPISAYINARRNYNPLIGGKIVKGQREGVQATFQYSDSTSDAAVWLAEFALDKTGFKGLSPAKLDFWIRQSFGERGTILFDAAGKLLPLERNKLENGQWYNRNIVTKGMFSTDPTSFGSTSDEFYSIFHKVEEARHTLDYFKDRGDKEQIMDLVYRRGGEAMMYKPMASFVDKAKLITNMIETIRVSDGYYSDTVKRKKIDQLTKQRTALYERAIMEYKRRIDDAQIKAQKAARRMRNG